MAELAERPVTREQAELLFDIDESLPVYPQYRLVLMSANNEVEPFETEEEVAEFVRLANRKWLEDEPW
jgi:hypothetical protein